MHSKQAYIDYNVANFPGRIMASEKLLKISSAGEWCVRPQCCSFTLRVDKESFCLEELKTALADTDDVNICDQVLYMGNCVVYMSCIEWYDCIDALCLSRTL